ncbi:MAG: endonuclease domain-containing protein [Bacteroidetes bacterium]|nr:endonuclease domain-containing protein [Bacteroidota bacterium]
MIWYSRRLKGTSRALRNNMTDSERFLWARLRRKQLLGYQFYRQKTIGNYIVDFYCAKAKLVIEVDGSQHYTPEGIKKDRIRDAYLESCGLRVLHFSSRQVMVETAAVLERIYDSLAIPPCSPLYQSGDRGDFGNSHA